MKKQAPAGPSIAGILRSPNSPGIRAHALLLVCACLAALGPAAAESSPAEGSAARVLDRYCFRCHDGETRKGGLDLEHLDPGDVSGAARDWERVVRKLRSRQMPPVGKERPDESGYDALVADLTRSLDRAALAHPDPGRTETFRRLNRTEYQNAIRDLLDLEFDATTLLPPDDAGHGFDNVSLGDLSPTLLDRFISAAQRVSRLAIGASHHPPGTEVLRLRPDLTQEEQAAGLPPGTRGGALFRHTFPLDGTYDVQIRLARDRNEEVEGLHEPQELEVMLDRERLKVFRLEPPSGPRDHETADAHLKLHLRITAGPHQLGVTFLKNSSALIETARQPYDAHFNMHRHPRLSPAIFQVAISGPAESTGPGDTPSRRRVFVCKPATAAEENPCAERILTTLMRRAYRRPVHEADLAKPMSFFREARAVSDFEGGIEAALGSILMNPEFLFRIEPDPAGVPPASAYPVSDLVLASRLSFFLWSSIPDDILLDDAIRGRLSQPGVLECQTRRMLADDRARNLVSNFGGQWLHLRNLEGFTPDLRLFPDFDDNLRQAFRLESEHLFGSILRENRSALDLLRPNEAYLNERLAKHYGIPHVYGTRFRRLPREDAGGRGGLLRQGSILSVTSYATRTSPVLRGQWILASLTGCPPPPPPGNVPALADNPVSATLPMRERLAAHRSNAACAGCHDLMDPVGFALENFDAVGRWRATEDGHPIDASGQLPDGRPFEGVSGLEEALLRRPELLVGALTEKLMTFALGRGVEPSDAPAVRAIVREAGADDFRLSTIIQGIVKSVPFTMRRSP